MGRAEVGRSEMGTSEMGTSEMGRDASWMLFVGGRMGGAFCLGYIMRACACFNFRSQEIPAAAKNSRLLNLGLWRCVLLYSLIFALLGRNPLELLAWAGLDLRGKYLTLWETSNGPAFANCNIYLPALLVPQFEAVKY